MKLLLTALLLLPFSLYAQTEYMNNDGLSAPETIDQAVEEGRIQREEAEEDEVMQKEEAQEEETSIEDENNLEEEITPGANAQDLQQREEERIEDNYLIGPYNGKGEFTLPKKEDKTPEP